MNAVMIINHRTPQKTTHTTSYYTTPHHIIIYQNMSYQQILLSCKASGSSYDKDGLLGDDVVWCGVIDYHHCSCFQIRLRTCYVRTIELRMTDSRTTAVYVHMYETYVRSNIITSSLSPNE